jgi:pyruvate dehydrogenase E2 component (dihydrolipoamide acetyltransferase)
VRIAHGLEARVTNPLSPFLIRVHPRSSAVKKLGRENMAGKTSSNPNEFLLPDLGEGLDEAELIEWCVTEGQQVEEHDVLAKMETDKAAVDVPSPRAGTIAKLHGKPGERIKVNAPLVTFKGDNDEPTGSAGDDGKAEAARRAGGNGAHNDVAPTDPEEAHSDVVEDENENAEYEDAGTVVGSVSGEEEFNVAGAGKVRAAPAVRKLARDLGVDLERVQGTGIGGRITSRDVQAAAAQPQILPPPRPQQAGPKNGSGQRSPTATERGGETVRRSIPIKPPRKHGEGGAPPRNIPMLERKAPGPIPQGAENMRIPFRGVRRRIAEHLKQSVLHAVHFTIMDEADVTALDSTRRRLIEATGTKISFLPLVAAAVCRVISGHDEPRFNRLNSTVDEDNQEIIQHRSVHLGIATDTEEGLMVPVIPNAHKLKVLELHEKIGEMAKKARGRSISMHELHGSTFTISNFGSLAGRFGTPIINHPEAGILAVGRARDDVVVRDGMIGVGKLLPLSLSADHRVIDGGTAAMALAAIIELLQNPEELLPVSQR